MAINMHCKVDDCTGCKTAKGDDAPVLHPGSRPDRGLAGWPSWAGGTGSWSPALMWPGLDRG